MKKSFSLIELIITITVVTIVSIISITIYFKRISKARDSKRIYQLQEIDKVIKLYLTTNNIINFKSIYKKFLSGELKPIAIDNNNYIIEFDFDDNLFFSGLKLNDLLVNIPKDPLGKEYYKFAFVISGINLKEKFKSYQIGTTLENFKNTNLENSYIIGNFTIYSINPSLKGLLAGLKNYNNGHCYQHSTGKLIPYKLY